MASSSDIESRLRECERRIEQLERRIDQLESRIGLSAQQLAGLREGPLTS